jgi:serine/threonine protein kinase/tetratricopeptide (TPR) repeat protein
MDPPPTPKPERIEALFLDAMARPAEEREDWVREACGAEPELAGAVLERVRTAGRADAFLERLSEQLPLPLRAAEAGAGESLPGRDPEGGTPDAADPPARIGPWRLVRILGRGGMGAVHLGERDDGAFDQRVAIKVLAPTLGSRFARARFDRERRILARMEHPNVARLLDGGVTPEGLPYLAMEYVEGRPIDQYVREEGLSVEARLQLYLQVLEAVRFAHANLVIHRDLKPSNILVDQRGTVKLLDFGIARLLEPDRDGAEPSTLTRGGMVALTPAHASPEQLRGEVVTTASDVFSLGILLHLLLTGQHPFRRDGRWGRRPGEGSESSSVEREMLTRDPVPPSHQVESARLRRRLRGDLDTIVATALQPSLERRYPSVDSLREDLRRHLAGLPIRARADRVLYRASRFVKRHAWGVGVAAAGVVAVVGGLLLHSIRLGAERDRAEEARAEAEAEARKAGEVTAFLVELFEAADPFEARGEVITALDLVDRGDARLERLAGEPVLQAELAQVLALVNENLGRYDRAEALRGQAVGLLRVESPGSEALGRALTRWGVSLGSLARVEEAESAHREALGLAEGRDPALEANVLHNLGAVLRQRGELAEAEAAFRRAVALRLGLHGTEAPSAEVASSLHGLGTVLYSAARFDEALEVFREAAAGRRAVLGDDHPLTLSTIGNIAGTQSQLGHIAEARATYLEVLEARRRTLGPTHPDVATALHQLAMQDWQEGDWTGAEAYWIEAMEIRRAAFGPDHPQVAGLTNNLAAVARERGDLAETEALLRESLRIYRAAYGPRHPDVAQGVHNLAATLADLGRLSEAEGLYRDELALRLELLGEHHTHTAHSLHNLGRFLTAVDQWAEAEDLVARALAVRTEILGEDHPLTQESADILGRIQTGRPGG